MSSPSKVLAINFGGIGDEVLFLPTLATVKRLAPECKLTLLVEPRSKSVMEVTDLIDDIITFDIKKKPLTPFDLVTLTMLIRKGKYDMVISSGSSPMVAMLLFLSGIKLRVGYDAGGPWKSLLTHPVKLLREQYAADMYHDLTKGMANYLRRKAVAAASIREDAPYQVPKITIKSESLAAMQKLLDDELKATATAGDTRPLKTVLIHPGTSRMAVSKGIIKTWSSENWLEYIKLLQDQTDAPFQTRVVLAGGPDDKEVVEGLEAEIKKHGTKPYISAVGKTKGLADLAALTQLCDVLVCVDSAPMHIGVGLNKKIVALFGPTDPAKLIPNQANFKVLADRPAEPNSTPRTLLDGLGVRLRPETVFRSSLDLLQAE
jgi:ADP-heptose:LPS heptosyltransferase